MPVPPMPSAPAPSQTEALIIPFRRRPQAGPTPGASKAGPTQPSGGAEAEVRVLAATSRIVPPRPPEAAAANDASRQRLMQALATLDAALAAQRESVAKWRESLATLKGSVQGLGDSLRSLDSRLGHLGERVGTLNGEARRLEAWADGVLAREAPAHGQ